MLELRVSVALSEDRSFINFSENSAAKLSFSNTLIPQDVVFYQSEWFEIM